MAKHTIPMEELSKLEIVSVGGNLYLTGWNQDEIRIKDMSDTVLIEKKKKQTEIHFPQDALIHVPHNLLINIQTVGGDASIRGIGSNVTIGSIDGDLSLVDVNSTSAETVGGDVFAKRVQGDFRVENAGGDVILENISGQVGFPHIGGDLQIEKVAGGIDATAGGDGTIDFHPVPWQAYQISVGGNLSVTIPADTNADLSIQSNAEDISIILGEVDIKIPERKLNQQLGEGGPTILLSAGGKVFLASDEFSVLTGLKMNAEDFGSFAADFSTTTAEQFKNSLGNLEEDLRESLSGLSESLEAFGISEENLKKVGIQIEESSRLAAEKAEMAAVRAQAKVERKIAQARRKVLKIKAKTKEFDLGQFLTNESDKKNVSEDERLLILKMLQEKKISLEEADDLLKTLEGKKK
ncbi:MAG: hypothetical protein MUP11_07565 [Anaerolineales bacterium]|nr:hypothetical protein [Anaerolineales bacterium]